MNLHLAYNSALGMWRAFIAAIPRLAAAFVVVVISLAVAHTVRWTILRVRRSRDGHDNLWIAIARVAYAATAILGFMIGATVAFPSFTVGSMIQLLGVSGVVVGFAFKDIFQNFLGGLLILVTNPFYVGDQIVVGSFEGTVEEIQARATLLQTFDRRRVVVPNADLFTQCVVVNTAFESRREEYDLELPPDIDLDAAKAGLAEVLGSGIEGVARDPKAEVVIVQVTPAKVVVRLRWWSPSKRSDFLLVQDRVLTRVESAARQFPRVVASTRGTSSTEGAR
jgi:small-conductance mechanosensitive channel